MYPLSSAFANREKAASKATVVVVKPVKTLTHRLYVISVFGFEWSVAWLVSCVGNVTGFGRVGRTVGMMLVSEVVD
ncbi:uncharacterized protein BDR25DRAFT_68384 [Lindgomyces ingoldianus]|uniref:Uncharacterized protein n=1 Tax=Lindgomyces ingoldianus TaxID=673940 RepID=A0ACB6RBH2_9PLEO|nr:uncharacterized protein BDR25DRAFT_68384 [Lindgomyces ingoldianus]KAF2476688.1 hypothetical protein BDR25DRAFT_68384 [Lindgomyces ingoldianus]